MKFCIFTDNITFPFIEVNKKHTVNIKLCLIKYAKRFETKLAYSRIFQVTQQFFITVSEKKNRKKNMTENGEGCKKKPQALNTTLDPLVAYLCVNKSADIKKNNTMA